MADVSHLPVGSIPVSVRCDLLDSAVERLIDTRAGRVE